jgi:tetratricopeptide (TPR) repeat protein
MVYAKMGKYLKALSSFEQALEIDREILPSNHPTLAISYNNIASIYFKIGEYSKAASFHQKSLEIKQKTLPPNHPDLISSYNTIGTVFYEMGEYSKALSSFEQALEISANLFHKLILIWLLITTIWLRYMPQ